jgi:hypothetical protein
VRLSYLANRPARLHRLAESIPWHRFLDSLNIYKYGLWIDVAVLQTKPLFYIQHDWHDKCPRHPTIERIRQYHGRGGGGGSQSIKTVENEIANLSIE